MEHDWELMEDPLSKYPHTLDFLHAQKSDVHICRICHQLALSEVGHPPPADPYGVTDCGECVVGRILSE